MKQILSIFLVIIAGSLAAHADAPTVEAAIAVDADTKPTDSFSTTVPKLNAFFKSTGTVKGDKLRGVWIAEDVGDAAPANTKIDEDSIAADQDNYYGAFSITKPDKGWPPGKYRIEIYLNDELATTVKFTIAADK